MIDGNLSGVASYGTGGVIAIVSILMVFTVLIVIIVLTEIVSKVAGKDEPVSANAAPIQNVVTNNSSPLNLNDEDALVASLVASIDYRNETKKNIQVIGVREVK